MELTIKAYGTKKELKALKDFALEFYGAFVEIEEREDMELL